MGIFLAYSWALRRLKKSDIECVILAGSSLLMSVSEIAILVVATDCLWARAARDFFKDFDVLAPKILIFFCILAGSVCTRVGILAPV